MHGYPVIILIKSVIIWKLQSLLIVLYDRILEYLHRELFLSA